MNDRRLVAVLGVLLGATALVLGVGAANADNTGNSTRCTNGTSGETTVPVPFVGVAYEAPPDAIGPDYVAVCYSTTPHGSSSPEAAGGYFLVANPLTNDHANLVCEGDRATSQSVVVECENRVTFTDPTSAPGTTATSTAKVGTTGPVNVGQTGAEVNPATTTNAPLSGAAGTGGSLGAGSGTCVWISGSMNCPFGTGATVAGVTVHEGDLPTATTTNTTPPPACTGINNTCPGAYVIVGGDSTNPTVVADLAVVGRQTHNVPKNCVQVNSICPP